MTDAPEKKPPLVCDLPLDIDPDPEGGSIMVGKLKPPTPEKILVDASEAKYLCSETFPDHPEDEQGIGYVHEDLYQATQARLEEAIEWILLLNEHCPLNDETQPKLSAFLEGKET